MVTDEVLHQKDIGYWFLFQLFRRHINEEHYVNFRLIFNPKPGADAPKAFNHCWTFNYLKTKWYEKGGYYDQLQVLNSAAENPANVYYGLAPRLSADTRQTKENCLGFIAMYLDLDVTAEWSLQDRWQQIVYWSVMGLCPSIIVHSGHGLQVIWCLREIADRVTTEAILKRMVDICGCKGGGNCFDVTRILRFPGFLNQKYWFNNDSPPCRVVYPSKEEIFTMNANESFGAMYDLDAFVNFPESRKEHIADVLIRAQELGSTHARAYETLTKAMQSHQGNMVFQKAAAEIAQKHQATTLATENKHGKGHAPIFDVVPDDFEAIPIPKSAKKWFKLWCLKGKDGLTNKETLIICKAHNIETPDASSFDAKAMYQLVKCRYSFNAIEKFWQRPDLKLWREQKMQSNANYLRITYDKMFEMFSTAMDQAETLKEISGSKNELFVDEKGYTRINRANGTQEIVITGTMKIQERYHDLDAVKDGHREFFLINAVDMSKKQFPLLLRRAMFSDPKDFKNSCQYDLVSHAGVKDLDKLLTHLLDKANEENVPVNKFNSAIKYDTERHGFVFPNYTVFKDSVECRNNPNMQSLMLKHYPLCKAWLKQPAPKEAVKKIIQETWPHLLGMHHQRLIMACLGSLASFAMRQIFLAKLEIDISMPTLNIRGKSCSGKTETLYQLFRLTGCAHPGSLRMGTESTSYGLSRMIEDFQAIPMVIDEFKEEDEGQGKNKHMQIVRALVRRVYSGEMVVRGRADLSIDRNSVKSALWISGESVLERSGHLAEMSRVFPIDTNAWSTGLSKRHWDAVRMSKIEMVGPHFYQFLLTLDPGEEFKLFTGIEERYAACMVQQFGQLASRIATNVASLTYGLGLWDRFLINMGFNEKAYLPGRYHDPHDEFVTYMINYCNRSGSVLRYTHKGKELVRERDEALDFLSTLGKMTTQKHKYITELEDRKTPCYVISQDRLTLYVFMDLAYDAYRSYCLDMKYPAFEKNTIMERLYGAVACSEPWIAETDHVYTMEGRPPLSALMLDLPLLQDIKGWPRGIQDKMIPEQLAEDITLDPTI